MDENDLFLEKESDKTKHWVAEQNKISESVLCDEQFLSDRDALTKILTAPDKLVIPRRRGEWLYDFLIDKTHVKGLWRRRRPDDIEWQSVFDFDDFCATASEEWEWRGAVACPWKPSVVMIALSLGGSDQAAYFEFDCDSGDFVEGGFELSPAKTSISWVSCDELLVGGGPAENASTQSGWPRVVRRWKRKQRLEKADIVFEAKTDDLSSYSRCVGNIDNPIQIITRRLTIGQMKMSVGFINDDVVELDLPENIDAYCDGKYLALLAKDENGRWPQGTLVLGKLSCDFKTEPTYSLIYSPSERCAITAFFLLKDWLVFIVSNKLVPQLFVLDLSNIDAGAQQVVFSQDFENLLAFPETALDIAPGNTILVTASGPLTPPTLFRFEAGSEPTQIEQTPARFDTTGMSVQLLEAESDDGEMIPYHLVRPANAHGITPTIIYGYGGFGIAITPHYSASTGLFWLERGGAYVFAHIRGGNDFGPAWHDAAKGPDNKPISYMDMAVISKDLEKRGFCVAKKTAAFGGSNGGLLAGMMLIKFPALFGAIWSAVPVLDLKRFTNFAAGKAWIEDYGDPSNDEDWEKMAKFSPYHLVQPDKKYPPVYFETSTTDDRVHPSHARRMTSKMLRLGYKPLFHESDHGGHGGGDMEKTATRLTMGFSFLRKMLMNTK